MYRLALGKMRGKTETLSGSNRSWGSTLYFHRQRERRICKLEDQKGQKCLVDTKERKQHLGTGETEVQAKGAGEMDSDMSRRGHKDLLKVVV